MAEETSAEKLGATIEEIKPDDSITSAFAANQADLYVKTGMTGGKRFLVKVNSAGGRAALIALHL